MDILFRIITIMESKKINQKELTNYLGVQNTVFTKWKAGTSTSYLKHISKIAEYLNVSTDYLLGTEQKNKALSEDTEKALLLFNNLTDDKKALVIKMMENLK